MWLKINKSLYFKNTLSAKPKAIKPKATGAENSQRNQLERGIKPSPYTNPQLIPNILIIAALWLIVCVVLPKAWGQAVMRSITTKDAHKTKPRNQRICLGMVSFTFSIGNLLVVTFHIILQPHSVNNAEGASQ